MIILDAVNEWIEVPKEGTITVAADRPVLAKVTFTNLGEAKLLTPWGAPTGGVTLRIEQGSTGKKVALDYDVPHQSSSEKFFELLPAGSGSTGVVITFEAEDRARFGERFAFVVAR